jgi:hypothetical protein
LQGRADVDRCGDHGAGGARHHCVDRRSRERHSSRSPLRGVSHAARMDASASDRPSTSSTGARARYGIGR